MIGKEREIERESESESEREREQNSKLYTKKYLNEFYRLFIFNLV